MTAPLYIGGPVHGLAVSNPGLHCTERDIAVIVVDALDRVSVVRYARRSWFVAPGRPLVTCFALQGLDADLFFELGRQVLPAGESPTRSSNAY